MPGKVTIRFSAAGVEAPVYVVTSLSSPAWDILPMYPAGQTESGENIFAHTFDCVAPGSYQYKIRIGEGHWVIDGQQETTTDESGNQNNVVHVTEESIKLESDQEKTPSMNSAPIDNEDNVSETVVNGSDDGASDTKPEETTVDIEAGHIEPGTPEEQAAPLLSHEQQPEEPSQSSVSRKSTEILDIIEEESSTQASSAESHNEENTEDDQDGGGDELQNAPAFGYEQTEGDVSTAPQSSDDRTSGTSSEHSQDPLVGGDAPTLPHETMHGGDESGAPLLPYEYPGGVQTPESSDGQQFHGDPAHNGENGLFTYGGDEFGTPMYPGRRSSLILRTGTSSSLPHVLPRSDDEDPDLNDPSLQPFPTDKNEILARVGTIRTTLPQDETIESPVHSPFVGSQACSSVDVPSAELGPVTSQGSLNAVIEEEDDLGELPSPPKESPEEESEFAIRMRLYGGCPGPINTQGDFPTNTGTMIHRNDGAQDEASMWSDLAARLVNSVASLASPMSPEEWINGIPSDADSARPPTDDTDRTLFDSLEILPHRRPPVTSPRSDRSVMQYPRSDRVMQYPEAAKHFERPVFPDVDRHEPNRTVTQILVDSISTGIEWLCGCCGLCGPQSRTVRGIMAFVVVGIAYYAYDCLYR